MASSDDRVTISVEEEFLIIDPETRRLRPQAEEVVPDAENQLGDHVDPEFKLSQVETSTPACESLEELRSDSCSCGAE
jgi:glutamate---cysteine ligase / carboxylate-amine ligase